MYSVREEVPDTQSFEKEGLFKSAFDRLQYTTFTGVCQILAVCCTFEILVSIYLTKKHI